MQCVSCMHCSCTMPAVTVDHNKLGRRGIICTGKASMHSHIHGHSLYKLLAAASAAMQSTFVCPAACSHPTSGCFGSTMEVITLISQTLRRGSDCVSECLQTSSPTGTCCRVLSFAIIQRTFAIKATRVLLTVLLRQGLVMKPFPKPWGPGPTEVIKYLI